MTQLSPHRARQLRAVLAEACSRAGLHVDPAEAALLKYVNNAVYQLAEVPVIVRIGIGGLGRFRAPRIAAVARWLADRDAPTVRLADGIENPMFVGQDFSVTFWQALPHRAEEVPWTGADLASPLKAVHSLDVSDSDLPRWEPFKAAGARLAAADPALPAEDLAWLRAQWDQTAEAYRALPPLSIGLVHGDAHPGNLLCPAVEGTVPVLADLDSAGVGPVSWDLAVQATDAMRFADNGFYTDFAAAYGREVTDSPEWAVLSRIRELLLVTSAVPDLSRRPAIAAEHAHRLHTLRTGDPALWHSYR
ncbi:aminoglycoside phosphotransferase family protein [Nocardia sp. alder85J]|uniref:aminoglycoside phosphotransferase family protein n=1 Tax=Nocardia sp. alder85J TaxID=2862949 RepID=UPI001CD69877|nr:aminoglycoside phosphotransferase family protein [Nocardia sp. alder85J]MCX4097754.1 aminoglycoside phosphotransferase family protein [Nocardia sp. alder85J]